MSYDLMVFDPSNAPREHADFMRWYGEQTLWNEDHSYNDPAVTSANLHAWFMEIIQSFPPLNGPLSEEELPEDEASATDYSIGRNVIYAAFAWSKVESAYQIVFDLAEKHNVGFFNVSSGDEEVWLPQNDSGKLVLVHQKAKPTLKEKLGSLFRSS
jgi:hypothetical protein